MASTVWRRGPPAEDLARTMTFMRSERATAHSDGPHLIFVDDLTTAGWDARDLRRQAGRGFFVRVRRGVYCSREVWDRSNARERHSLAVRAAARAAHAPFLVAGRSAAGFWGMPFAAEWPADVTFLAPYRGGGKSEPGVRRTSAGARGAVGMVQGGVPLTTLARTALDVARGLPLPQAVAVLDWTMWRKNPDAVTRDQLKAELRRAHFAQGGAFLVHALDLATDLSDSVGESEARIAIHLLGFEPPELQVRFVDSEGEMFPDFFWRGARIAGEFDGKAKYTRAEYGGDDPAAVVWREKKREDRLRRQVGGLVRILTEHVRRPDQLAALLVDAGVPRRTRRADLNAPDPDATSRTQARRGPSGRSWSYDELSGGAEASR